METEKIKIVFGANLRQMRIKKGMTQADLARKSGTVGNYVALMERGEKFPSADMIERLAAALGVESPDLFKPPGVGFSTPWGQL